MPRFPQTTTLTVTAEGFQDWENIRDGAAGHSVRLDGVHTPCVIECVGGEDTCGGGVERTQFFTDLDAAARHYRRLLRLVERAKRLQRRLCATGKQEAGDAK